MRYEYRLDHKNNNASLENILAPLFAQLERDPHNKSTIGKIILISFTKNESTQIPTLIKIFLDGLFASGTYMNYNEYPINIFDFEYNIAFYLLGCFFAAIPHVVNNYPRIRIRYSDLQKMYAKEDIKSYLRCVRETCMVSLYGNRPRGKFKHNYQYYRYNPMGDLDDLLHRMRMCYDLDGTLMEK